MVFSLRTSSKRSGFRSGFLRFRMGFRRFPRFPATFPCVSRSTDSKNGGFLYWFLEVSALSGNLPLRFSMDREHKLPKLIIYPTKRTEKFESVTFPCLNQTGEESLFRFFWPSAWSSNAWGSLIPWQMWLEPSPLRPGRPRRLDDDDHDDDGYDGDDDGDDVTTKATPP